MDSLCDSLFFLYFGKNIVVFIFHFFLLWLFVQLHSFYLCVWKLNCSRTHIIWSFFYLSRWTLSALFVLHKHGNNNSSNNDNNCTYTATIKDDKQVKIIAEKKVFDCLLCILVYRTFSLSLFVGYCNFYNNFDYLAWHKHKQKIFVLWKEDEKVLCTYDDEVNKVLPSNFFLFS